MCLEEAQYVLLGFWSLAAFQGEKKCTLGRLEEN